MTQEKKELLLKDLCARLPYGIKVHIKGEYHKHHKVEEIDISNECVRYFARHLDYRCLIPMGLALEAPEGMYNTKTE